MSSDLSGRPLGAWYGGIYVGEVDGGVYILIIIRPRTFGDSIRFSRGIRFSDSPESYTVQHLGRV